MNRKILCTLLLCIAICTCRSQLISIKPSAGLNLSDIGKHDGPREYSARWGFIGSASAIIGRKFYFEPGLFYVRKETHYFVDPARYQPIDPIESSPDLGNITISGVQIPLAFGYRILSMTPGRNWAGLRVFGGGSTLFLRKTDQTMYYNKTHWGLFTGLGIDLYRVFLDARYEWTFTDQQPQPADYQLGRSRSLYLNLGFRIPVLK